MRRILMATVATIILLWSTTPISAHASSRLQTRSFRTNLVKGEYVEAEAEDSVDEEPIDVVGEITTDPVEIAEPQESDEHTDVSTPTDIAAAVDEEPTQSQLEAAENTGNSTEPEVETPIDSEDCEENEEEHETEVQSTQ